VRPAKEVTMRSSKKNVYAAEVLRAGVVAAGMLATSGCDVRFISPRYRLQFSANPFGVTAQTSASAGGAADRVLRAQNYHPVGSVIQQTLPPRGLVSFQIPTQPGSCYTVFAVGDVGANDVDLAVISPSGQNMGEDRGTDPHPNVSFCAFEYGVHLARVNMYSGSGNVYFAVYQGPAGTTGNVEAAFTGRAGAGTAVAAAPGQPDPSTAARIASFQQRMAAQGYQAVGAPRGVMMASGQTDNWPTQLSGGWCYAFATFGGPGVRDSDVFLFDAAGARQIAGDAGPSPDAVIRDICTTATASYQLRPRLYSGQGPVWFVAMARPNAAAGTATASVTQTPLAIATHAGGVGSGGVEGSFRRLERALVSLGYQAVDAPVNGTLSTGTEATQSVTLEQGKCYAIAAVGDATVQDLDLFLLDAAGNELDRDYAQDARPVVRVCPRTTGQYSVRMRMVSGQGGYRVGLFRWEGGISGAGMSGLLFVRNAEITRVLQADGYQGDANFELFRGRIRQGASATRNVNLQQGACYAFVAVGGDGVSDLNMSLQQGGDTLAEDRSLTAFPSVRYCARASGPHRVVIQSAHGSGDFVFRVFRRGGTTS
jgi:hypothetical protein